MLALAPRSFTSTVDFGEKLYFILFIAEACK